MADRRLLICGWCPTELPDSQVDIQAHFLAQHQQPVDQSIRYVYPGAVEAEFCAWMDREARRG